MDETLGAGLTLLQQQTQHEAELALEQALFEKKASLHIETDRRERIRDRWALKNNSMQTLLVAQSLMFSCAFMVLTEMQVPDGTSAAILIAFSTTTSLSLCVLLISIFCALTAMWRMSRYDISNSERIYLCGKEHRTFVSFWDCHCRGMSNAATVTFYAGTGLVVASAGLQMSAQFSVALRSATASYIFAVVCTLALVVGATLLVRAPSTTRIKEISAQEAERREVAALAEALALERRSEESSSTFHSAASELR